MKPIVKRLIIYIGILIILGIGLAVAIGYFNEEKIKAITIEQLNELLDTEVSVDKIEFSLLQRFPKASIQFKQIAIVEKSSRKEKLNILEATSLFLEFDPFDLLSGNYTIDQIYIKGARFNIIFFNDGSNNFQFLKEGGENENFRIQLQHLVIKNSTIRYTDTKHKLAVDATISSLNLSGDFQSSEFDLNVSAKSEISQFSFNQIHRYKPFPFNLDLVLNVQQDLNKFSIRKAKSSIGSLTLSYNGVFTNLSSGGEIDLSFSSEKFKFKSVLDLLPSKLKTRLSTLNAKGIIDVDGSVKGTFDSKNSPLVNVSFSLKDGSLENKSFKFKASNIGITGKYTNGPSRSMKSSLLDISEISFAGKHGTSNGRFSISNFEHPLMKIEMSSSLDLNSIHQVLQNDSIENLEGQCHYSFKGESYLDSLSSISANDLKGAKLEGNIRVESARLKWRDYAHPIENIEASAVFGDNLIYVDSLTYSMAGIESELSGTTINLLPYLFFPNEKLHVQANIHYPDLNLNYLFEDGENKKEKTGILIPVSPDISLKLNLSATHFKFEKFKAQDVRCKVISDYPIFHAQNLTLNAMEGGFAGWLKIDVSDPAKIIGSSQLTLSQVNLYELFYQFENFGQENIVADNLKGYANADISFYTVLDENLSIQQESVKAISHIEVKNGELIDYKPMLALSKYVDVEELQRIKFSRLVNDIEIKNRMVIIPEMEIKSSALELKLSGKHSFDNDIDYHFQLWLNDFLFKKAKRSKKNKEEFGEVETDESGRAKLFVRMQGTVDDYKIKLDRKALREKWKEDLQEERVELKELFKSEFGKEEKKKDVKPVDFELEWDEFEKEEPAKDSLNKSKKEEEKSPFSDNKKKKTPKKGKLGREIEDEYEEYDPDKYD